MDNNNPLTSNASENDPYAAIIYMIVFIITMFIRFFYDLKS